MGISGRKSCCLKDFLDVRGLTLLNTFAFFFSWEVRTRHKIPLIDVEMIETVEGEETTDGFQLKYHNNNNYNSNNNRHK